VPGALTPSSPRRGLALAAVLFSQCAGGVGLGDIEVRSSLGQVLDARIPLALEPGKTVDASCFSLMRGARDGAVPTLVRGALTLERTSGAAALRIRSPVTISEPALSLRIRAACPGRPDQDERQYTVLLDPRPDSEGVRIVPVIGASLAARPGDTLQSIAAQVFPENPSARAQYLAALREANPDLARGGEGPLPAGAAIALPDLRTYARGRTVPPAVPALPAPPARPAPPTTMVRVEPPVRTAALPKPEPATKAAPSPAASPAVPAKTVTPAPPARVPAAAPPSTVSKSAATDVFMLKLSTPDVNLAPTRGMDDRKRAQLRERLALLDEDDHVAALLSLRNNVRQLESRVAELQLKLATLPPSPPAAAPPTAAPPAKAAPPVTRVPPPAVKAEPAPKVEAAQVAEPTREAEAVTPRPAADSEPFWKEYLTTPWAAVLLALALLAAVLMRRPRRVAADGDATPSALLPAPPPAQAPPPTEREYSSPSEPAVASDAGLATQLPENSRELRRRYIEERFPEIANRTLVLEDPSSVVKGARLFYEDGAIARAVELLKFSIEDDPAEVRPWLALFEIFRLERRAGEFAALARRFHDHHGNSEYWRKVQYFGREIDPANPLYQQGAAEGLETIGPKGARRAAASFDAAAENWLEAPMDFENEVLANELRQGLMGRAALSERDLDPNPMPALRTIEMFRVA
jgi:pilus assembly protein FimV